MIPTTAEYTFRGMVVLAREFGRACSADEREASRTSATITTADERAVSTKEG
jgi:hypothetical protein